MKKREMQGAVLYGTEDVRLETVDVRSPGPGEVLVRIHRATTCGTDLKVFHRGGHARMLKPPTLFGHEFSGVVECVGEGIDFVPGQRVVCHNSVPCMKCFYCERQRFSLCESLLFLNGAFAEYITVPAPIACVNLYRLPDHVAFEEACLMEPLSCVLHGVDRTPMSEGDTVVVIGDGAIGQMFVWVLAMNGMRVIHVGSREHRLDTAKGFGALHSINYRTSHDLISDVRGATNGQRGADAVIECTGKPAVWESAIEMVRPGGAVNLFGGCPKGTTFTAATEAIHYNEITVMGVFHTTPRHVKAALDLLTNRQGELRPLISCELPLEQLHTAFDLMDRREAFKVSIKVSEEI